ncbi:hypothetical protein MBANPS3_008666 [Mucor bainieri]
MSTNFLVHQVEKVRIQNTIINYAETSNLLQKFRFVKMLDITALNPEIIDVSRVLKCIDSCRREIILIADPMLHSRLKAELEIRKSYMISVVEWRKRHHEDEEEEEDKDEEVLGRQREQSPISMIMAPLKANILQYENRLREADEAPNSLVPSALAKFGIPTDYRCVMTGLEGLCKGEGNPNYILSTLEKDIKMGKLKKWMVEMAFSTTPRDATNDELTALYKNFLYQKLRGVNDKREKQLLLI